MYDALVSINVPTEKAKAVIDAMEREMMDKVATKVDLEHAQQMLSRDMQTLRVDINHKIEKLESRLVVRLGQMIAASLVLTCTILGTLQALR
jgi:hypothetical protein